MFGCWQGFGWSCQYTTWFAAGGKDGKCQGKLAPSLKPVAVEGALLASVSWGSAWLCLLSELRDAMERVGKANENRRAAPRSDCCCVSLCWSPWISHLGSKG